MTGGINNRPKESRSVVLPALVERIRTHITSGPDDTLTCAALDRHRLSVAKVSWKPYLDDPIEALVPADALAVASHSGGTGTLTLTVGHANALFGLSSPTRTAIGRQLSLEYPAWRTLIPTPGERWVRARTADLRRAVGQVAPAIDRMFQVNIDIDTDAGALIVAIPGERSADATIDITGNGDPIQLSFNGDYLRGALDMVEADEITCYYTAPHRPVLMHGGDPELYEHVLMPMRPLAASVDGAAR